MTTTKPTPAEIATRIADIDRHLAGGTLPAGLRAALKRERARLLAVQEGGQA